MHNNNDPWLKITDEQMTSADLQAAIERRVSRRRRDLGEVLPQFPQFAVVTPLPEVTFDSALLAHHLRLANEMGPLPLKPVLAPSPATRIPILGKLWGLVRAQFHELILFYVNRTASHQARLDSHLLSTLNELARIVQEQQVELERLRREANERRKETDGPA